MTARAIVSGVLFRDPVAKTSKTGNAYALATIREGEGDRVRWWKAFVFSESARDEIMRLSDGEPVSVAGEFDCELYTPPGGGESRLSWKIVADAVLSARRKPRPRDAAPPAAAPLLDERRPAVLDDDIPFMLEWR